jgi:hypothetical protein
MAPFIHDSDLRMMITLNSAFFHLGMNARYRRVSLASFLGEREIKLLVHLMYVNPFNLCVSQNTDI